jgi:hypothetical protein
MTAPQTFDSHHRISVRKNLDIPSNAVFNSTSVRNQAGRHGSSRHHAGGGDMSAAVLTRQTQVRPVAAVRGAAGGTERASVHRVGATRRARLIRTACLAAVLLAVLLGVLAAVWSPTAAAEEAGPAVDTVTVVVEEGESLWSVVVDRSYDRDPRVVLDEVQTLNGMNTGVVHPGRVLELPAR